MKILVTIAFIALSAILWGAFYYSNKKKFDKDAEEFNNINDEDDIEDENTEQ